MRPYIYVILHPAPCCMDDHLIGAFTNEKELKEWWDLCVHRYKSECEIWKIMDGGVRKDRVRLDN